MMRKKQTEDNCPVCPECDEPVEPADIRTIEDSAGNAMQVHAECYDDRHNELLDELNLG